MPETSGLATSDKAAKPVKAVRISRINIKTQHYDRTFKQRVVLFSEIYGNREAEKKFEVSESNIRRWKKHKAEIFSAQPLCCKIRGRRKTQKKSKASLAAKGSRALGCNPSKILGRVDSEQY